MIEAGKACVSQLFGHVGVIPPAIPDIPAGVTVEVAHDQAFRCGEVLLMKLQVFVELTDVFEGRRIRFSRPDGQQSCVVDGTGQE